MKLPSFLPFLIFPFFLVYLLSTFPIFPFPILPYHTYSLLQTYAFPLIVSYLPSSFPYLLNLGSLFLFLFSIPLFFPLASINRFQFMFPLTLFSFPSPLFPCLLTLSSPPSPSLVSPPSDQVRSPPPQSPHRSTPPPL